MKKLFDIINKLALEEIETPTTTTRSRSITTPAMMP